MELVVVVVVFLNVFRYSVVVLFKGVVATWTAHNSWRGASRRTNMAAKLMFWSK